MTLKTEININFSGWAFILQLSLLLLLLLLLPTFIP
jgi:hypothetical protein